MSWAMPSGVVFEREDSSPRQSEGTQGRLGTQLCPDGPRAFLGKEGAGRPTEAGRKMGGLWMGRKNHGPQPWAQERRIKSQVAF